MKHTRNDTYMTSMKIVQFSRLPTPLVHLRQKFFHPLDLGRPISNEPHHLSHSLQMIANQLKENIMQGWLFMLSSTSFRSDFVFSINSLILFSFPLTSFHLAETSLYAFSWLYSLVCAVVQKYEMSFIYNCLHCTTWKRKQTMKQ